MHNSVSSGSCKMETIESGFPLMNFCCSCWTSHQRFLYEFLEIQASHMNNGEVSAILSIACCFWFTRIALFYLFFTALILHCSKYFLSNISKRAILKRYHFTRERNFLHNRQLLNQQINFIKWCMKTSK